MIQGMDEAMQDTWRELFKVTHQGESFEDYSSLVEPSIEENELLDQE